MAAVKNHGLNNEGLFVIAFLKRNTVLKTHHNFGQKKEFDQKCTFGRDYVSFWGPVTFQGLAVKLPGIYVFLPTKKNCPQKKRR